MPKQNKPTNKKSNAYHKPAKHAAKKIETIWTANSYV